MKSFKKPFSKFVSCLLLTGLTVLIMVNPAFADGIRIISAVAGNGTGGFSGDGGVATSAQLYLPNGVAVDGSGNLYIADLNNNRIRKVNTSGKISTVAGTVGSGFSGDGGAATSAKLNQPCGVAVDTSGNLYIADGNNRIRKVNKSDGKISTVAGNGYLFGTTNDGVAATSTTIANPNGVAVDASGNIYIADKDHNRIRKVDTSGIISTVAGTGASGFSGDGGAATSAKLNQPCGVAVDTSGNLYITDRLNNRIRKVNTSGKISTVAGTGTYGYSGDGGPATSAQLKTPYGGVALDGSGNLYITDSGSNIVRKVDTSGIISTVAGNGTGGFSGDGGAATSARLWGPTGVAVDDSGNLYIADSQNNRIRKVIPPSYTVTYNGNGSTVGSAPSAVLCVQGGTLTVAGNSGNLAKAGCSFAGWNTAADGNGTFYNEGSTFTMGAEDTILYAYWLSGTGTSDDPFLIKSYGDLKWVSSNNTVNSGFSGKYFKQLANIDMSSTTTDPWVPIGDLTNQFSGTYDGNGYSVDSLHINSADPRQGLFGVIGATGTVKDLGVTNVNITCSYNNSTTGALVGNSSGTLLRCFSTGTVKGKGNTGGLAGYQSGGSTSNCFSRCTVSNYGGTHNQFGGLIGKVNDGTVSNCYATGDVNASGRQYVGGLTGALASNCKIYSSFATGKPTGADDVGYITGSNSGAEDYVYITTDGSIDGTRSGTLGTYGKNKPVSFFKTLESFTTDGNWKTGYTWDFTNTWAIDPNGIANDGFPYFVNSQIGAPTAPPSITTQPTDQTVTAGETATFSIVATGDTPLSYQWKKDGTNINGAMSATLTITNVQAADVGSYICEVTNGAGSVTSNAATLTVNPAPVAPSITAQPADQTVTAGQTATFSVAATGDAPLSYQWKQNGTNISGETSAILTITNAQAADAGSYTCEVTNGVGSVTSNAATLTVNQVPVVVSSISITTPATKLVYTVGDELDLSGLVVTGTYSDNSTQVETVTAANVTGFNSSAPADGQILTITIGGKTTTYTVNIVEASANQILTSSNANVAVDNTAKTITYPMYTVGGTDFTQLANIKSVIVADSGYIYEIYQADGTTVAMAMEVTNVLKVLQGGNVVETYTFAANIKYGDVNGDGALNTADLTLLQRYILNPTNYPFETAYGIKAADINKDNVVNSSDRLMLQRYLNNAQNYPIPSPTEFLYNPI